MTEHLRSVRFCRYADDGVIHCKSRAQAGYVLHRIAERFRACALELRPEKTRIVYCRDINRPEDYPVVQFTFLGYTFRPRKSHDLRRGTSMLSTCWEAVLSAVIRLLDVVTSLIYHAEVVYQICRNVRSVHVSRVWERVLAPIRRRWRLQHESRRDPYRAWRVKRMG